MMRVLVLVLAAWLLVPLRGAAQVTAAEPRRQARELTDAEVERQLRDTFRSAEAGWLLNEQDPADSLYRRARELLNRNEYARSSDLFRAIRDRYPRSAYVPDSYYWEAFAQFRRGGEEALKVALSLLEEQGRRYPEAATRKAGDAAALETRIQGALARRGDEAAAAVLADVLREVQAPTPPTPPSPRTTPTPPTPPTPPTAPRAARPPRAAAGRQADRACRDADDDVQAAALNAVLQMDADRALPILQRVLARRDEGSLCLRRRAVFIVSQHEGAEVERILLSAARTDPDGEVRGQAVFWLSQVDSPLAVAALDSILAAAKDPELQEKAIFALSQHDRPEAQQGLRRYAERADATPELREKAVFWLGQSDDPENVAFLQGLYGRISDPGLKERILFSVGQSGRRESGRWLAEVARTRSEPIEVRKKALFWLGQRDETTGAELAGIYDTFTDRELKEQIVFVLSQKGDRAAVDKLMDIVRRETDRELQKKALFWLGQSDDPRVADFLAEYLAKP